MSQYERPRPTVTKSFGTATTWHPEEDATPTPAEVQNMAATLEARHGVHAASVADFFSGVHAGSGDAGRSWAWAAVAEAVRRREQVRRTKS